MKSILFLIICLLSLTTVSHGQDIVDGLDSSSKHYNKDVRVSVSTNRFGISTVIVELSKMTVPKGSNVSVVLRSPSKNNEDYIYLPLLVEDGDERASWSARTGQNVTRTWMRGRHGIFFSTLKMPNTKLQEYTLEVLIGEHMKNPTFQYAMNKIKEANK